MNKIFIVLLAITVTTVVGQSCTNFLATKFGFAVESNPIQSTGLNFCNSFKTTTTCCDSSIINTFQTKTNTLLTELTQLVSGRDTFLIQARKVAYSLRSTFERLKTASAAAVPNLEAAGNEAAFVLLMAVGFSEMATQMVDQFTTLQEAFIDYQTDRRDCVMEFVNLQAAAWCLACDPNFSSKGISGGALTISDSIKTKLVEKCVPFILLADSQNVFITLYYTSAIFSGIATAMEQIAGGNTQGGLQSFAMALVASANVTPPSSLTQTPVEVPGFCSENGCDWLFTDVFNQGLLDKDLLAAGGAFQEEEDQGMRLLREKDHKRDSVEIKRTLRERMLTGWEPEDDEAGVEVDFQVNPANIDNDDLSSVRAGLISFSLAFLAILFF